MSFRRGGGGNSNPMHSLPFGLGYNDVVGQNDSLETPTIALPVNSPISLQERSLAVSYIKFLEILKDNPFFDESIIPYQSEGDNNEKRKNRSDDMINEDGIKRFSDKYIKKRKIANSIDNYPYNFNIFPNELYSVMGLKNDKKRINLKLAKSNGKDDIFTGNSNKDGGDDDEDAKAILANLKNLAEDEDEQLNAQGLDDDDDEDDDNFEADEDDDDDYNAQGYFEADENDDDDDGDAGGDEAITY